LAKDSLASGAALVVKDRRVVEMVVRREARKGEERKEEAAEVDVVGVLDEYWEEY